MILDIRFLNSGYCRQLLALVDRRDWRIVRFWSVFLAVRHSTEGWILIDTGYGGRFRPASRSWPYFLYRWLVPVVDHATTPSILHEAGIDPTDIRHVVLTHFHADHVGGLTDFPESRLHFHEEALRALEGLSPIHQIQSAFLPSLVPSGIGSRGGALAQKEFAPDGMLPFATIDLFGDGSLRLVDLPGHAPGHLGVLINTVPRPILYVADAYWSHVQVTRDVEPSAIAMRFQWDGESYADTISKLRDVRRTMDLEMLACHCWETQEAISRFNPLGPKAAP